MIATPIGMGVDTCAEATEELTAAWKNNPTFIQYSREFDRATGKMAMLEKLRTNASSFDNVTLSQELLRVAVWVAFIPKQSIALRECARLLAALLALDKNVEPSRLLQGALHLVALRLQEAPQQDEYWEKLRCSKKSHVWRELERKCPHPDGDGNQPSKPTCRGAQKTDKGETTNIVRESKRKFSGNEIGGNDAAKRARACEKVSEAASCVGSSEVDKPQTIALAQATEDMTHAWKTNPTFQCYLKEFDRAPGKMAMLEKLRNSAGAFDDVMLSRELLRVAVWVAFVPKQSIALRECARLLAVLLLLRKGMESSDLLRGALHLVALRLQDAPTKDEHWETLRRSKQRHEWLELETKCPYPASSDETASSVLAARSNHEEQAAKEYKVEHNVVEEQAAVDPAYTSRATKRMRKYMKKFAESRNNLQCASQLAVDACTAFEQAGTHARKCHLLVQSAACLAALMELEVTEQVQSKICKAVVFCLRGIDLTDEATLWRDDVWTALESIHACMHSTLPHRVHSCKYWKKITTLIPEDCFKIWS